MILLSSYCKSHPYLHSLFSLFVALFLLFSSGCSPSQPPSLAPTPTGVPSSTPTAASTPTPGLSPSPTPTPFPLGCPETKGEIVVDSLKSDYQPKPFGYRVYLPPCYDSTRAEGYPSLYLLHGQSSNDDQWDRMGVDLQADRMIVSGEIQPLIIVMPREEYFLNEPLNSTFDDIIVKELVPLIDKDYNTCAEAACRAIGGLSRGAGWAVRIGFNNYQLFQTVGAHSLAIFAGDTSNLSLWLQKIPTGKRPMLYIDIGIEDSLVKSASFFLDAIIRYRILHEWHMFTGTHDEKYWSSHIPDYLRWYNSNWK